MVLVLNYIIGICLLTSLWLTAVFELEACRKLEIHFIVAMTKE